MNGAQLYHEVRGSGPSLLFISGATGDAGHFEWVAEVLSDEFTVVTYDRRGNSRSPRPVGWDSTSPKEQADDAAGLIEALGLAPAAVFGTSGGEIIEGGMARGGPRAAVEAFARFVAGDENFEKLNPELRERMLDNGEILFGTEFGAFESYRPDDATLAAVEVRTLPGGHAPYLDRPEDVAEEIRPFLRQVS